MQQKIANLKLNRLDIEIEDIEETFRKEEEKVIVVGFRKNVKHYIDILYNVVDSILPKRNINPEDVNIHLLRKWETNSKIYSSNNEN